MSCSKQRIKIIVARILAGILVRIQARILAQILFRSLGILDQCRVISLLHDSSETRYSHFCLFDSRSTAHQLVTSINSKHPSCLFAEVGNGRANFNEIYIICPSNQPKYVAPKTIFLRLKKRKTCEDNIIDHFSCLKRNIRAQYVLNILMQCSVLP